MSSPQAPRMFMLAPMFAGSNIAMYACCDVESPPPYSIHPQSITNSLPDTCRMEDLIGSVRAAGARDTTAQAACRHVAGRRARGHGRVGRAGRVGA